MKLKNIFIVLGLLAFLQGVQSCIDDRGNYDYIDLKTLFPVTISGFGDTSVIMLSTLHITPVLDDMDDESRYTHLWFTMPTEVAGSAPRRDTISRSKELAYKVSYKPASYTLVYELRDPKRDIYAQKQVKMTVESDLNLGWYVMKEVDDQTDIDYVNMAGEIKEDLILGTGNERLAGKPVKMFYQSTGYSPVVTNPDGTMTALKNQRAFHVFSDRDIKIFNPNDMTLFYNYEGYFFEAPEPRKPQNISVAGRDIYVINDGKAYTLNGMTMNSGKLGAPRPGKYDMHPDMTAGMFGGMFFDKESRTFYELPTSGSAMRKFRDKQGKISPTNMEADLIRLLPKTEGGFHNSFALMKNENRNERYLFTIYGLSTNYPFTEIDTIPLSCEMPEAKVMAAPLSASCIYYAKSAAGGDELKVYKNIKTSDREAKIKSFPGEKIAYIVNVNYAPYMQPEKHFNHLVVLTNSESGWKLYRFEIVGLTPEIKPDPLFVYSGKGKAACVTFRP